MSGYDVTEEIVESLGLPAGTLQALQPGSYAWDVAIGGVGFLTGPSAEFPYLRETAQWRREQLDTTREPGEQSLTGLWLRSQSSFHLGAQSRFFDPELAGEQSVNQFADSDGVDVWTKGRLSLLPEGELKEPAASRLLSTTADGVIFLNGTELRLREWDGSTTIAGGTAVTACVGGNTVYHATPTEVYKDAFTGASLVAALADVTLLLWAKERLLAFTAGGDIYDLSLPLASGPLYSHPSDDWVWTAAADLSGGILVAGYAGNQSAIFEITLSTDTGTPVLNPPVPVVQLPLGERVHSLASYLGAFVAVGTSRGVRVGAPGSGGFSLGPLAFESDAPVECVTVWNRYVYAGATAGVAGVSGLWRLDMGEILDDGRVPAAPDVRCDTDTGAVTGVLTVDGTPWWTVAGAGLFTTGAQRETGWIQTSRIRFNTAESKAFTSLRLGLLNTGRVGIEASDNGSTFSTIYTTSPSDGRDVDIDLDRFGQELSLRLTLHGDVEVGSYQLRAAPAGRRQRMIEIPLLCFAEERDRKGSRIARPVGTRIQLLEGLEEQGRVLLFQDFALGETRRVTIERVRFVAKTRAADVAGAGGWLILTVKGL